MKGLRNPRETAWRHERRGVPSIRRPVILSGSTPATRLCWREQVLRWAVPQVVD